MAGRKGVEAGEGGWWEGERWWWWWVGVGGGGGVGQIGGILEVTFPT